MVGIFAPQVVVANRSPGKVDTTVERAAKEGIKTLRGTKSPAEFISSLSKPRKVILLVMAGNPVDDTIAQLSDLMDEGDMIIDGGNEWFPNSVRRSKVGEGRQGGAFFVVVQYFCLVFFHLLESDGAACAVRFRRF